MRKLARFRGCARWPVCLSASLWLNGATLHAEELPGRVPPATLKEDAESTPDWRVLRRWPFPQAIRGVTIGPIENQLHPGRGYGSAACARTMSDVQRLGGNWVSITPFGRVLDLHPTGIARSFEINFTENRKAVMAAVRQAHAQGLRVMLVPHLWVETGDWRGLIDPGTDAGWKAWARAYDGFVATWAKVAESAQVDLLAVGIELRRWVTTDRADSFLPIIQHVRSIYKGPLTYAANWDDVEDTVIWGDLDVIGVNAFYPLAEHSDASFDELYGNAKTRVTGANQLAARWSRPFIFTEFGYTTRRDPALRPWEWPEALKDVVVDETAQALAYRALLSAVTDQRWFAGLFVWRVYADPDDVTQEPAFGFSFRGKSAERELRRAFARPWSADYGRFSGYALWAPFTESAKSF